MEAVPVFEDIEDVIEDLGADYIDEDFNYVSPTYGIISFQHTHPHHHSSLSTISNEALNNSPVSPVSPEVDQGSVSHDIQTNKDFIPNVKTQEPSCDFLIDSNSTSEVAPEILSIHQEVAFEIPATDNYSNNKLKAKKTRMRKPGNRSRGRDNRRLMRRFGKANFERMKTDPEFKSKLLQSWKDKQNVQKLKLGQLQEIAAAPVASENTFTEDNLETSVGF